MEVINFMSDDKTVNDSAIKLMTRLSEYKELGYVIKRNKYPIEHIEQIVGENGNDIMIRCVVENKKEKNFDVLEKALAARDIKGELIEERIELLPYASKEFAEQTAELVMNSNSICHKYNYLMKTKDKRYIQAVEDEVIEKGEIHMMIGLAAFVPGINVARFEDYYIKNCGTNNMVDFMLFVPKCSKTKLDKIIDSEYLVSYRLKNFISPKNDYSRIYDSLVKLGKKEYIDAFFGSHETKKIKELSAYATTEKQKAFLASLNSAVAQPTM